MSTVVNPSLWVRKWVPIFNLFFPRWYRFWRLRDGSLVYSSCEPFSFLWTVLVTSVQGPHMIPKRKGKIRSGIGFTCSEVVLVDPLILPPSHRRVSDSLNDYNGTWMYFVLFSTSLSTGPSPDFISLDVVDGTPYRSYGSYTFKEYPVSYDASFTTGPNLIELGLPPFFKIVVLRPK